MKQLFLLSLLLFTNIFFSQTTDAGWILLNNSIEKNNFPVTLANGRIGLTIDHNPFTIKKIILNGIYDKESAEGVSKIVQSTILNYWEIMADGELLTPLNITRISQTLNMKTACFETIFEFQKKVKITTSVYALYNMPYCVLTDIHIEAQETIKLEIRNETLPVKGLVDFRSRFYELKDLEWKMPMYLSNATTKFKKYGVNTSTVFMFDDKRPKITAPASDTTTFTSFTIQLTKNEHFNFSIGSSVCTSVEFADPKSESERMCISLLLRKKEDIIQEHLKAWEKIWENDIIIEGDLKAQQDVRFALFNIFSSARKGTGLSIPPMGLTSQGYNGHIFWDMELWMFPVILAFDQELAASILDYRFNRLTKAKQKAESFGFKGAMFPWESDDTGEEATPTWALTGTFEQHITADIGIACWNYYRVTKNKEWLKEKGYPLLKEIADFWSSRVKKESDGFYHINNVVGANEFQQNINDNAFTNASAITVLNYAVKAAQELNIQPDSIWKNVASKIIVHHFADGVTKENSTYNGDSIKQADVNLLSYPLNFYTDEQQIKKDLKYYEARMAIEGPAMSHCVLSVIYSKLGNKEQAYELFKRSYQPNQRGPFGVLSESAKSNNPYFLTGAGGMLQGILYGFAGLEITDKGLLQNKTNLPKEWKSITLKGIGVKEQTVKIDK